MGKEIYLVVEAITFLVFIFGLIIGIKVSRIRRCPSSFTYFYFYPLVGIIVGSAIYCARFDFLSEKVAHFINTSSLFFHFYFLSNFIYKETEEKSFIKFLIILFLISLLFFIISDIKYADVYSFAFANGTLFIFCMYYFYLLLNKNSFSSLKNNPVFIICCGIFFGTGLIIPFSLMNKYLLTLQVSKNIRFFYVSLSALGYLIMNLFFLKALLLCKKLNK